MNRLIATARFVGIQSLVLLISIAAIDIVGYATVSSRYAYSLPGYKEDNDRVQPTGGREGLPRDYFVPHELRGFDNGKNKTSFHVGPYGLRYPIWSNDFGCFDRNWTTVPDRYFYFAGDSMTWGYTPFEDKFATVFENKTRIPSLKCGVVHTGTVHQLSKFIELSRRIGHFPERVIVGYVANDVADDYSHPHSTVIDGWQVDKVFVDRQLNLVAVDEDWIRNQIRRQLEESKGQVTLDRQRSWVKKLLRRYSISAQVINRFVHRLQNGPVAQAPQPLQYGGRTILKTSEVMFREFARGRYEFEYFPYAKRNKEAISAWREHSRQNSYKLFFVLFPIPGHERDPKFYVELMAYLDSLGIEYLNLAEDFAKRRLALDDIYFRDGHINPRGNKIVGDILSAKFPH